MSTQEGKPEEGKPEDAKFDPETDFPSFDQMDEEFFHQQLKVIIPILRERMRLQQPCMDTRADYGVIKRLKPFLTTKGYRLDELDPSTDIRPDIKEKYEPMPGLRIWLHGHRAHGHPLPAAKASKKK
jgi:hypothetical protein